MMNHQYDAYGSSPHGLGNVAGGGGFLGASQDSSQQNPGASSTNKSRMEQTMFPLTIKQVTHATPDPSGQSYTVDGRELMNVRIVGVVLSVDHRATHMQLSVSDGTGTVDVRRMFSAEEQDVAQELTDKFRQGLYVVVSGRVRMYQNEISVTAYSLNVMDDANQLTHHFLDVVHTHLLNTRGPIVQQPSSSSSSTLTTPMKSSSAGHASFHTPTQQFSGMAVQNSPYGHGGHGGHGNGAAIVMGRAGADAAAAAADDGEFTKNQRLILDVLSASMNECGASLTEITQGLQGQLTEQQAMQELNYLTNEGHVYSTIDDMHFKRTE